MDELEKIAAAVQHSGDDDAPMASSASAFLKTLGQQLCVAGSPGALEQVLSHARSLWSDKSSGGQALLEAVCWDVLPLVGPYAAQSLGCQAAIAAICLDIATTCAPREAVTVLLAALGSGGKGGEVSWGLRLALVHGLAAALPLVSRRKVETFRQVAPPLLAGLRGARDDPPADSAEGIDTREAVDSWAAGQFPGAVVSLSKALLASLQPGEEKLQTALARFALQVLGISAVGLPLAAPAQPGSTSPEVPSLLLAALQLLPPTGLTPQRTLRIDLEDAPGEVEGDSDDEDGSREEESAEVERGRALAATCLLCLPAPLLPWPIPTFSAEDLAGAVALAGPLLQGPAVLASKGLALISAAANAAAPDGDAPLAPELLDGVQASLESLTMLMLLLPEAPARQAAYGAFRAGLSVLPPVDRLSTLERFIATCPHQPVVSLLLHLLKEEVARALPLSPPSARPPPATATQFPGERILALVASTLAPPGRTPQLPNEADVVVAALNLYRFLLLREAAVGRSWTGALSPASLEHARSHWLLPLRHVAAQAAAVAQQERQVGPEAARGPPAQPAEEGQSDRSHEWREKAAVDMVREVLHRVLELVEDALRQGPSGETQPG